MCTPPSVSIPPGHHATLRVRRALVRMARNETRKAIEHDDRSARAWLETVAEGVDDDEISEHGATLPGAGARGISSRLLHSAPALRSHVRVEPVEHPGLARARQPLRPGQAVEELA